MRLLWFTCLLVGSITCLPVQDSGPGTGEVNPRGWPYPGYWVGGQGSSDPTVTSGPVVSKPDQQVQYVYGGSPGVYGGSPGVYNPQTPDGNPDEPFFSDVSDLDSVYNFHSRSRYRRGRAMFSQTRYVPVDSLYGYQYPVYQYPVYQPPYKGPVKGL